MNRDQQEKLSITCDTPKLDSLLNQHKTISEKNDDASLQTPQTIPYTNKYINEQSLILTEKLEILNDDLLFSLDLPKPQTEDPSLLKLTCETLFEGFFGFVAVFLLSAYVFFLAFLVAHAPSNGDVNLSIFYITSFWIMSLS